MSQGSSKVVMVVAVAVLAGMAAMTFTSISERTAKQTAQSQRYALPELRDHLDEVRGIAVTAAGETALLTLRRDGVAWKLKEKGDYPADTGAVRALLQKLSDARLLEARTAIEQQYAELGVEDVKNASAQGVRVTLEGLAKPSRLIVGKTEAGGTFVRRPEERKAWLAQGDLSIERSPAGWLDKDLADVSMERISDIVLTRSGVKPLRLLRRKPGDAMLPAEKGKTADTAAVAELASALSNLQLQDVAGTQASPPADAITVRYGTAEGIVIDIQAWRDEKPKAQLTASLDPKRAGAALRPPPAGVKKATGETPVAAAADAERERQQNLERLSAEVQRLNERFAARQFVLPEERYAALARLVPQPKPASGSGGGGPAGRR